MFFKKWKYKLFIFGALLGLLGSLGAGIIASFSLATSVVSVASLKNQDEGGSEGGLGDYTGGFTPDVPRYKEVKGDGNKISDKLAQLAVGTAVKYHLLPSVILSQYAYESSWGQAPSALLDNNNFGITWFGGAPFPAGTPRGIGGSEGGFYMRFPKQEAGFSYYGFMIATQSNFKMAVGKKSPGPVLLDLGRGGYAEAGITEDSPYYINCMSIIASNQWVEKYDKFAIAHWKDSEFNFGSGGNDGSGSIGSLEKLLGQQVGDGQCYALSQRYVMELSGFKLLGLNAHAIGSDNLASFEAAGWKVIFNPTAKDLVPGAVVNWLPGPISSSQYGHTGIVSSVKGNNFTTYEQNIAGVQTVQKMNRTWDSSMSSVCIPPK